MTILNDLPYIFMPLVGLVFPVITMASLSLHIKKTRFFRFDGTQISYFIYISFKT